MSGSAPPIRPAAWAALSAVLLVADGTARIRGSALAQDSAAFTVGVLRRDAIVVPFAVYDGKHWESPWPKPREVVDVPIQVRGVPSRWWGKVGPVESWQAWIGGTPRTIKVTQPDWYKAHCLKQLGLRTDYRPAEPPPPPDTQPYPKDALVVAPAHPIEPITTLPASVPPPAVDAAFAEAEEKTVSEYVHEGWTPPADKKIRAGVALKAEAIYAFGDPAVRRVYYFEASKQYERGRAPQCPAVAFGGGFFVSEKNGPLRKLTFNVDFFDCDRYGILYMLPFGAVQLNNHLYWLAQRSGWDDEWYQVIEIGDKTVEFPVRAWGGGC
jgi:hypothetical protein